MQLNHINNKQHSTSICCIVLCFVLLCWIVWDWMYFFNIYHIYVSMYSSYDRWLGLYNSTYIILFTLLFSLRFNIHIHSNFNFFDFEFECDCVAWITTYIVNNCLLFHIVCTFVTDAVHVAHCALQQQCNHYNLINRDQLCITLISCFSHAIFNLSQVLDGEE